jgi:hypothetical protein
LISQLAEIDAINGELFKQAYKSSTRCINFSSVHMTRREHVLSSQQNLRVLLLR